MKRIIATIVLSLGVLVGALGVASARPHTTNTKPALPASYIAVYCYPTGTYWAAQVSSFPTYYKANNAYYMARYGANTEFC